MDIQLKQAQYDKLMYYAQIGAAGAGSLQQFEELRQAIETDNGIKTYVLVVSYQEVPLEPAPFNVIRTLLPSAVFCPCTAILVFAAISVFINLLCASSST